MSYNGGVQHFSPSQLEEKSLDELQKLRAAVEKAVYDMENDNETWEKLCKYLESIKHYIHKKS